MEAPQTTHLTKDDLDVIDALLRSPVYRVLQKMIEGQRQDELRMMSTCKDWEEVCRIQGTLRGLALIESLPVLMSQFKKHLDDKEKITAINGKTKR